MSFSSCRITSKRKGTYRQWTLTSEPWTQASFKAVALPLKGSVSIPEANICCRAGPVHSLDRQRKFFLHFAKNLPFWDADQASGVCSGSRLASRAVPILEITGCTQMALPPAGLTTSLFHLFDHSFSFVSVDCPGYLCSLSSGPLLGGREAGARFLGSQQTEPTSFGFFLSHVFLSNPIHFSDPALNRTAGPLFPA